MCDPITLVLGDKSIVKVKELVLLLNIFFETRRSNMQLGEIEFRVIPGEAEELLIGKSEIQRLRIPTQESLMDEVAMELESKKSQREIATEVSENWKEISIQLRPIGEWVKQEELIQVKTKSALVRGEFSRQSPTRAEKSEAMKVELLGL